MHSNTAADLRNSLRFFTGGVGWFSDGICRVSLTVGEVSVMVSVSKWFASVPSETAIPV